MAEVNQHIDKNPHHDNRNYNYQGFEDDHRSEYDYILNMIPQNAMVIDLGCGNGALLQLLTKRKNAKVQGVEISSSGTDICLKKNIPCLQAPIDQILPFPDNAFDYAICNVTLQMVNYPEILLSEMNRISKHQIISFPNFAWYKNRLQLLIHGIMPKAQLFGYNWYNTGHIHQLSIKDFDLYLKQQVQSLLVSKLH